MNEMRALIRSRGEAAVPRPVTWLAAIALPTVILLIFGSMFGPPEPDPALGGLRFIDVFVPSLVVITVGTLGIQTLPDPARDLPREGRPAPPVDDAGPPAPAPARRAARHLPRHGRRRASSLLIVVGPRRVRRPAAPPTRRLRRGVRARHGRRCSRSASCWRPWRRPPAWRRPSRSRCSSSSCSSAASTCRVRCCPTSSSGSASSRRPASRASRTPGWGRRRSSLPLPCMAVLTVVVGRVAVRRSGGSDARSARADRAGWSSVRP